MNQTGMQISQIAEKLGVTHVAVFRHLKLSGAFETPFGKDDGISISKQRRIVCDYLMGKSARTIANQLKIADYKIEMVLWRYGVPDKDVLIEVRRKQAIWMSESGKTIGEIAACLGVDINKLKDWFKSEGFTPPNGPSIRLEIKKKAVSMFESGESLYSIGKKLKVAPNSVRNWALQARENKGMREDGQTEGTEAGQGC